tara:strand:- start:12204 stop:14492 length:2289 start_codon:yes stop_codon:yes gene_type:complete
MAAKANIDIVLSNGKQAGQTINELRQQANRLTKEINNLKPGTDAFIKKSADLKQVGARLGEVRKEAKGVETANASVLQSFSQYIPFGGVLSNMAGGVRTGVTAFKSLRAAIAATGVGLLILAIGSLVAWFKRTESGAQSLRVIMAAVGQVFDSAMDVVTFLGEAIYNAFKNPQESIKQLWELIKTNIVNRITGVVDTFKFLAATIKSAFELDWEGVKTNAAKTGESVMQTLTGVDDLGNVIKDTFNKAKDGISDFYNEIKTDAQQAMDLAREENELKLKNRAFLIEEAQMRAKIAELREWATDVTRTDEERQQALAQAIELTNQVEAKKIALKAEQLRILKAQQEISITDEDGLEEAARLEAELIGLQEARASSMRRLTAQESALRKTMNDEQQRAIDSQTEKQLKAAENLQNLSIELMKAGQEKELALLQLQTERKIEALQGSEEQIRNQKAILLELEEEQIRSVKQKYADQAKADELKTVKDGMKKRAEEKAAEQERNNFFIEEARRKEEALAQIKQEGLAAFSDATDGIVALLSRDEAARKKNADLIKTFETARIAVGLQSEIQAIWQYANQNPANALFPGAATVIAAIKSAVAVGRAGAAISSINSQKFSLGGILRGASHAMGGIPGMVRGTGQPIEVEGDEIILTKGVSRHPIGRRIASNLNAAFGGRKFEAGGPINPFNRSVAAIVSDQANSGSAGAGQNQAAEAAASTNSQLLSAFNNFAGQISTWQRNLKVSNNLQETEQGLKTLSNLKDQSEI